MNFVDVIKITVSATKSLNKLQGRWAMYNSKKTFMKELEGYELIARKDKRKAYVEIIRYGSRSLDVDNFYGGLKPLIDCLKAKGLIVDDNATWLELDASQGKCKRCLECTKIEIGYYPSKGNKK